MRCAISKSRLRYLQISDLNTTLKLTVTPPLTLTSAKLRSAFCKLRRLNKLRAKAAPHIAKAPNTFLLSLSVLSHGFGAVDKTSSLVFQRTVKYAILSSSLYTDLDSESATLVEADEIPRVPAAHFHSTIERHRLQLYVCCRQNANRTNNNDRLFHTVYACRRLSFHLVNEYWLCGKFYFLLFSSDISCMSLLMCWPLVSEIVLRRPFASLFSVDR